MRNRSQMLEQASGRSEGSKKGSQKFESLYQDAMRRNERQLNIYAACIDAECTFQPDIESNKLNKRRLSSGSREKRVFERLSQGLNSSRERSQMMMANSQTLTNDLYDPETGQQFFKPKVGRAPRHQLRPHIGATHEMLYKAGQDRSARKRSKAAEEEQKKSQMSNTVFTSTNTKKMI